MSEQIVPKEKYVQYDKLYFYTSAAINRQLSIFGGKNPKTWQINEAIRRASEGLTNLDTRRLAELLKAREKGFYLTREDVDTMLKYQCVFDPKLLFKWQFSIFEGDNTAADGISHALNNIYRVDRTPDERYIRDSIQHFRNVDKPEAFLPYTHTVTDAPFDSSTPGLIDMYDPYCPEYLLLPPSIEQLQEVWHMYREELEHSAALFRVIPWYLNHEENNENHALVFAVGEASFLDTKPFIITDRGEQNTDRQDIIILDIRDPQDYEIIVNMLFNAAMVERRSL